MEKKPCPRCLLRDLSDRDIEESVKRLIAAMPEKEKADAALYGKRLDICVSCENLLSGTCLLCGCYAELRAAKKDAHCPCVPGKW